MRADTTAVQRVRWCSATADQTDKLPAAGKKLLGLMLGLDLVNDPSNVNNEEKTYKNAPSRNIWQDVEGNCSSVLTPGTKFYQLLVLKSSLESISRLIPSVANHLDHLKMEGLLIRLPFVGYLKHLVLCLKLKQCFEQEVRFWWNWQQIYIMSSYINWKISSLHTKKSLFYYIA